MENRGVNKTKRFFILFFLLLFLPFGLCSSAKLSLVALSSEQKEILPVDGVIGQIVQTDETIFHSFLASAISSDFGYEWLETYVNPDSRAAISSVFSSFLSENLPAKDFVMSALSQNGDGSVSISARINSNIVDFVIDGSYLVAMTVKKSQ